MRKCLEKRKETCRKLSLRAFLTQLVTSFKVASYTVRIAPQCLYNLPDKQIGTNQSFLHWFSPRTMYLLHKDLSQQRIVANAQQ